MKDMVLGKDSSQVLPPGKETDRMRTLDFPKDASGNLQSEPKQAFEFCNSKQLPQAQALNTRHKWRKQ
jgi:hypothetical protein